MKKQSKRITQILFMATVSMLLLTGCSGRAILPSVTIDDASFTIGDTVQTILDGGLTLCEISGTVVDVESTTMDANTLDHSSYCIGRVNDEGKAEPTHLYVWLYNDKTGSPAPLKKCKVAGIRYSMTSDFYRTGRNSESVFINGYDFATLSPEQAVDAFEEMGISVEPDEREEYLKQGNSLSYLTTAQGNYTYSLEGNGVNMESGETEFQVTSVEMYRHFNFAYD